MPAPPDAGEDFTVTLKLTGPMKEAQFQKFKKDLNKLVAGYKGQVKITQLSVTPTPNP